MLLRLTQQTQSGGGHPEQVAKGELEIHSIMTMPKSVSDCFSWLYDHYLVRNDGFPTEKEKKNPANWV